MVYLGLPIETSQLQLAVAANTVDPMKTCKPVSGQQRGPCWEVSTGKSKYNRAHALQSIQIAMRWQEVGCSCAARVPPYEKMKKRKDITKGVGYQVP